MLPTLNNCSDQKELIGKSMDGKNLYIYTLSNKNGMTAKIINYGGIITYLTAPDKNGKFENVVLGLNEPQTYMSNEYINDCPFFGALIGRYGNRIAQGKFAIGNKKYSLALNNGVNHLHGGVKGFDKVVWDVEHAESSDGPALKLKYLSKDGEEGYPGNLTVTVIYTLTEYNALRIQYEANCDKETVCNLTHHSYFNLAGEGNGDILNHEVQILADKYTPLNDTQIPTGELKDVTGSPFDLRQATEIKTVIRLTDGGYDHNFVLSKKPGEFAFAAKAKEQKSGRTVEVYTTEPGIQLYTGNFFNGKFSGPAGKKYEKQYGFAMETQHFPDSPNNPEFPSTLLKPGQKYLSKTEYRFSAE
jgi:aldose 1-epimerase